MIHKNLFFVLKMSAKITLFIRFTIIIGGFFQPKVLLLKPLDEMLNFTF